jgi:hypothetical protein
MNYCSLKYYRTPTSIKMAQESTFFVKLGSGLVEIAALTALIGSATAESLTLGNKGAPGLAWAVFSTFGALSVVKVCVAGATPVWLRNSLGVRNTTTVEPRYKHTLHKHT